MKWGGGGMVGEKLGGVGRNRMCCSEKRMENTMVLSVFVRRRGLISLKYKDPGQ